MVELLVGVAIVTIIISSIVTAVVLVLRIHFQSVASRGAAALEQETMESVRSVAEGKWTDLYSVSPKGATTTYRIASSGTPPVLTVASGTEEVVVNNITYTRFFSVENVDRDVNGSIVATGGTEDPSTQKITVTVRWPISGQTAELKIAEYLTRSRSEVLWFTDWSGGIGVAGGVPPEEIACSYPPPAGRTIVDLRRQPDPWIISAGSAAAARSGPVNVSLPAGEYYATLVSFDQHSLGGGQFQEFQPKEQWYVLLEASDGFDVATTRAVSDLPTYIDNLQEVVRSNLSLDRDVTQATAIHAAYPDSGSWNSIRPQCAAFDRISDPSKKRLSSLVWNNYSGIEDISASSTAGELSLTTSQLDGWLDSSTYDTGVPGGAAFNSIMWQGILGSGGATAVKFQLATANCLDGETNPPQCTSGAGWGGSKTSGDGAFVGPDGASVTFYQPIGPGSPVALTSIYHNNRRFVRYKVYLERESVGTTSPSVEDIIVNWSP